jgi:hypothetical protein
MSAIPGYEGPAHPLSSLIEALTVLGVSENSDETPEQEFKESQNVQVHR